jgi:4-hydroxybenzoate polyprenyltransferase
MASRDGPDRPSGQGRIPRNRARLLIVLTFVVIIVVVFGYMILVASNR